MKKFRYIAIFFVLLNSINIYAGGADVYFGGDTIIADFKKIQEDLNRDIQRVPAQFLPTRDLASASTILPSDLKIVVKDRLYKDGSEIAFLNYPYANPRRVEISRAQWKCQDTTNEGCRQIVLHELCHLFGLNDTLYGYSTETMRAINYFTRKKTLKAWANPLFSTNDREAEAQFAYWVFININNFSNMPEHPFYENLKITTDDLSSLEKLVNDLKISSFSVVTNSLLEEIDIFIKENKPGYVHLDLKCDIKNQQTELLLSCSVNASKTVSLKEIYWEILINDDASVNLNQCNNNTKCEFFEKKSGLITVRLTAVSENNFKNITQSVISVGKN